MAVVPVYSHVLFVLCFVNNVVYFCPDFKSENYLFMKCVVVLKCFYKKDGHAFESTIVGSYKHIFVYVHVGNIIFFNQFAI